MLPYGLKHGKQLGIHTHTHTHQGSMSTLWSVLTVWTEGDFYPLFFFYSPSATDGHKTAGFPISPRERERNKKLERETGGKENMCKYSVM